MVYTDLYDQPYNTCMYRLGFLELFVALLSYKLWFQVTLGEHDQWFKVCKDDNITASQETPDFFKNITLTL